MSNTICFWTMCTAKVPNCSFDFIFYQALVIITSQNHHSVVQQIKLPIVIRQQTFQKHVQQQHPTVHLVIFVNIQLPIVNSNVVVLQVVVLTNRWVILFILNVLYRKSFFFHLLTYITGMFTISTHRFIRFVVVFLKFHFICS